METGACRACGATMVWTITVNGERQPFDPEPHPEGDFVLIKRNPALVNGGAPLSVSLSRLGLYAGELLEQGAATYHPHHATCPGWPDAKAQAA